MQLGRRESGIRRHDGEHHLILAERGRNRIRSDLADAGVASHGAFDLDGIVTKDGKTHPLDVLVFATAFHALEFLAEIDVRGRGGRRLADLWGDDDARAYLGMTVPEFPNLFVLYGPNTNLAHGGSIIFHAECQVRYLVDLVRKIAARGASSVEVKPEVHDDYNARVAAAHEQLVWTHPGVDTWYRNRAGRVVSNSPWRLVDYWNMTSEARLDDYVVHRNGGERAHRASTDGTPRAE